MEIKINTESKAAAAIVAIAHSAGTAEIYDKTLSRLYNCVLFNQDELGMDDTEAIDTLRVLALLRADIEDIASDQMLAKQLSTAPKVDDDDADDQNDGVDLEAETEKVKKELEEEFNNADWYKLLYALRKLREYAIRANGQKTGKGMQVPTAIINVINLVKEVITEEEARRTRAGSAIETKGGEQS